MANNVDLRGRQVIMRSKLYTVPVSFLLVDYSDHCHGSDRMGYIFAFHHDSLAYSCPNHASLDGT